MIEPVSPLSSSPPVRGSILTSLPVLKPRLKVTRRVTEPLLVSFSLDKQSVHGHIMGPGQIKCGRRSESHGVHAVRKELPGNPSQNPFAVTDPKPLIVNRRQQCKLLSMRADLRCWEISDVPLNPPNSRTDTRRHRDLVVCATTNENDKGALWFCVRF